MVSEWNLVCGRFINFKEGRQILTLLTSGCPSYNSFVCYANFANSLMCYINLKYIWANHVLLKPGVYTPTLKKYQVVRDVKKFENHWATSLLLWFNKPVPFFNLTTLQYFFKITAVIFYALPSLVFSCILFQQTRRHAEGILISICSGLLKMGMTETLVETTVVVVVMLVFATSGQLWWTSGQLCTSLFSYLCSTLASKIYNFLKNKCTRHIFGGRKKHGCKNLTHTSKTRQVKRPKWLQPRAYARGVGIKPSPWAWYFTKTLLPAQRRFIVFACFLLVNLSTYCKNHRLKLQANFKEHCKWARK